MIEIFDLLKKYERNMEPMHVACALQRTHRLAVQQGSNTVLNPEQRRLLDGVIRHLFPFSSLADINDIFVALSAMDAIVTPGTFEVLRAKVDELRESVGEEEAETMNELLGQIPIC